jgi:hypothetical protein
MNTFVFKFASDFPTGGLGDPIPLPYIRTPVLAPAFGLLCSSQHPNGFTTEPIPLKTEGSLASGDWLYCG